MVWLIRGKIAPETKNPINRLLIWAYQPLVNFVLRFRWLTLGLAIAILAVTYFPFSRLGKEFMPPLNEGTILFMPTAVPGMSINKATKILQIQDRMLRKFPRWARLWQGWLTETPIDPAPLASSRRPRSNLMMWRDGDVGKAHRRDERESKRQNGEYSWRRQTRTRCSPRAARSSGETGVPKESKIGVQIENALADFPNTRSVFAERTTGGLPARRESRRRGALWSACRRRERRFECHWWQDYRHDRRGA
jgi:Cu(I)/Ag(I) efflux system membrane protein CusA/SilA